MPKSPRARRLAAAVLTAALVPALAGGCAASFGAETVKPYIPADGVWGDSGHVKARNVVLVTDESGEEPATLVSTLLTTEGKDAVTGVRVKDATVEQTPSAIRFGTAPVNLGTAPADPKGPAVYVDGDHVRPGLTVSLTFEFAKAAPLTLDTLVVERSGSFATVPPMPEPPAPQQPQQPGEGGTPDEGTTPGSGTGAEGTEGSEGTGGSGNTPGGENGAGGAEGQGTGAEGSSQSGEGDGDVVRREDEEGNVIEYESN